MSATPLQSRSSAPLAGLGRLAFGSAPLAPLRDGVGLALFAFCCYWLLRQRALHGYDVYDFINWLQMGKASHHIHYLYMPLMDSMHRAGRWLGATPYQTLLFASCLGGALAVLLLHRAGAALGLPRADAALAAAFAAGTPAAVFFATVAEIHAVFYAFFGLACWRWAALHCRPSSTRALTLGLCTALAAAVHATGHLLVLLLPMLTLGLTRPRAPWLRLGVLFVLAHATCTLALDAGLRRATVDLRHEGIIGFILQCIAQLPLGWNIVGDVWREWLWPFLPLSVAPIVALFVRSTRRLAFAFWVAAGAFLAMTVILLFGKLVERGAYHLPLAWPAALLLLALVSRPWQLAALVLSVVLSVAAVFQHDHPHENPQLIGDLAQAAQHHKLFVVCEDQAEYEPLLRDLPSVPACPLFWLGQLLARGYDVFVRTFDELVGQQIDAGYSVVFTQRAFQLLNTLPEPTVARFMHEHIPACYQTEQFSAGNFTGVRLRRR